MPQPPETSPSVPKALSATMTLQFAVGGAMIPFITILLRDRGLNFAQISWIFFGASATNLAFPFVWGMLADRWIPLNRLFTVLNTGALFFLFVFSWQTQFVPLLLAYTAFYACFHPTLSLINALCFHHMPDPEQQFGRVRAFGSLGWLLPSLPAAIIIARNPSVDMGFVVTMALGALAATLAATLWLPHTPSSSRPQAKTPLPSSGSPDPIDPATAVDPGEGVGYWTATRALLGQPAYVTILISVFLLTGSFSLVIYYSPPYLEALGLSRAWIGPIQISGIVVEVILFPLLKPFLNRWGYTNCLLFGAACLVARHALYVGSENLWWLSLSYALVGLVVIYYIITSSILVNRMASKEVRATAQTLLVLCGPGLGPMFSNWLAGRLAAWTGDDLKIIFLYGAIQATLACLLIAFGPLRHLRKSQPQPIKPTPQP